MQTAQRAKVSSIRQLEPVAGSPASSYLAVIHLRNIPSAELPPYSDLVKWKSVLGLWPYAAILIAIAGFVYIILR